MSLKERPAPAMTIAPVWQADAVAPARVADDEDVRAGDRTARAWPVLPERLQTDDRWLVLNREDSTIKARL